jgi:hypothetical protein
MQSSAEIVSEMYAVRSFVLWCQFLRAHSPPPLPPPPHTFMIRLKDYITLPITYDK